MRTAMGLALVVSMLGCVPSVPVPPVPPGAVALRTPQDIDGVWLDTQAAKVRDVLTPTFGRLDIAEYKVGSEWTWEALQRRFDEGLAPALQRYADLPQQTRHFQLAAWSRDGQAKAPMVALAQIDAPPSASAPGHRVILVLTPRAR